MPQRPVKRFDAIVARFASRLREVRLSRGMTQAELAKVTRITETYITRLEAGKAAPGIDLVNRLARGLQVPLAELLPQDDPPDSEAALRRKARALSDEVIGQADRETLQVLVPLLARLGKRIG